MGKALPYKIVDSEGRNRYGVVVSSLQELIKKAHEKFGATPGMKIVLESDGTEVDEEYFSALEQNTCFMILKEGEDWIQKTLVPRESYDESPSLKKPRIEEHQNSGAGFESYLSTQSPSTMPSVSQHAQESVQVMNVSAQDFAEIRYEQAYVDKTMLIKKVLNASTSILIIAPRRFGKTINLSMLKRFFEILDDKKVMEGNRKLFEGLLIEDCPEIMKNHFGKHPVIFLDFRCSNSIGSFDDALERICMVVHKAYKKHKYLETSGKLEESEKEIISDWCDKKKFKTLAKTKGEIEIALENLAESLFEHWGKQVFVLVDEYDNICSQFILQKHDAIHERLMEDIIKLCAGTLHCLAKGNEHVERVVLTGVSYIITVGVSGLNNLAIFRFQENHNFSDHYGLTRVECKDILKKIGHQSKYEDILHYYNGYAKDIICTWSMMNCLNNRCILDNYWNYSGTPSKLYEALHVHKIRSIITKLLANFHNTVKNPVKIRYFTKINFSHLIELLEILQEKNSDIKNVDVFLNLLLEQGYFGISSIIYTNKAREVEIQIPNREISLEFYEQLELFCTRVYRLNFSLLKECGSIFNQLCLSDVKNKEYILKLFDSLSGLFETMNIQILSEASFHHILYLVLIYSNYKCFLELYVEENQKRIDILILTLNNVLIIFEIEFGDVKDEKNKTIVDADVGLNQILDKKYLNVINNEKNKYVPEGIEVNYYILVGIHMSIEKSISFSVLLNEDDFSKRINYPLKEN